MPRKPSDDPAVKLSFSLPESVQKRMLQRMRSLSISKVSEYIATLIQNDVALKPEIFGRVAEDTPTYKAGPHPRKPAS